jgi:hypothetical protein
MQYDFNVYLLNETTVSYCFSLKADMNTRLRMAACIEKLLKLTIFPDNSKLHLVKKERSVK